MLAQMAATAGSVAVGSTIGHGISHMLFGGGNSQPAEQGAPVQQQQQQSFQQSGISCETQAKGSLFSRIRIHAFSCSRTDFTKCLEAADVQACSWFLEQLKAVSLMSSDAYRSVLTLFALLVLVPSHRIKILKLCSGPFTRLISLYCR